MSTPTTPRREVHVVATGVANLASVRAALGRLGCDALPTRSAATVRDARAVVLPGVGAFGPAVATLAETGLIDALRGRIDADRPLLAICLGMQLLAESSDESPGTPGLGVLAGHVERFPRQDGLRVPQFGWNRVRPEPPSDPHQASPLTEGGHAYFANSFCLRAAPRDWHVAWAEHGGPFVAALARGTTLACQFHPELSSRFGHDLMGRWLETAFAPTSASASPGPTP